MALILEETQQYQFEKMVESIHELDIEQDGQVISTYISYLDSDPYNQESDNRVIILVPGIGSSVKFFVQNFDQLIGQGYRVIAVDLLGFGDSDKPQIDYPEGILPRTIVDLIQSLDLQDIHLFGTSLGATVCLGIYELIPKSIKSLILNAPTGYGKEILGSLRIVSLPYIGKYLLKLIMSSFITKKSLSQKLFWKSVFHDPSRVDEKMKQAYQDLNQKGSCAHAYSKIISQYVGIRGICTDLQEKVKVVSRRITIPTLLIWGKNDKVVPYKHAQRAHDMIKGSQLVTVDECAHMPYLEQPEQFNSILVNFLLQNT